MLKPKVTFYILTFFLLLSNLLAQTTSGKMTANETWRGTITLTGDVIIPSNVRLVIMPGTTVKMTPKSDDRRSGADKNLIEIIVSGEFLAEGTPGNQITFTSAAADRRMGDWYGIVIQNKRSTTSIKQAVIEYGFNGVVVTNSRPKIYSNVIQYNYNSGITCRIKARPNIVDNNIFANGWAGIFSHKKGNPVIGSNRISMNDYGIVLVKSGNANLGNIDGRGIDQNPGQNIIIGNYTYAIDNHSPNTVYAQNNTWAGPENIPVSNINDLIFDRQDSPGSGLVIFDPVFGEGEPALAAFTPVNETAANENADMANIDTTIEKTEPVQQLLIPTQTGAQDQVGVDNTGGAIILAQNEGAEEKTVAEQVEETEPEKEEEKQPEVVKTVVPKTPVNEWQIDQKRRAYRGDRPMPKYPTIAIQTNTKGQVIIQLVADESGNVISTKILKSDSEIFNEPSVDAAGQIKYQPMTIKGVPVKVKLIERYIYN